MRSWLLWRLFTSHLIWSSQKVHLSLLNPCQFLSKYCRMWNSLPQGITPKWINLSPKNELFASIFWEQSPQTSCQLIDAELLQLDADVNLLGLRLEILRFGERGKGKRGGWRRGVPCTMKAGDGVNSEQTFNFFSQLVKSVRFYRF